MADNIRIEGLDRVVRRLERIQPRTLFRNTMRQAAELVRGWIDEYPPATGANSPGQARWYERGYGTRWMNADGSMGGSRTSETLGRRWASTVSATGQDARVGNTASYAPFVQGQEQAWYHRSRGWRTTMDAVKEMGPRIRDFLAQEYRRATRG